MLGTMKGGFLCARQTGTGWEKIGGGGYFFETEVFNEHITKYNATQ